MEVKSYVTPLTTIANLIPAVRRTLEEFAVEINRQGRVTDSLAAEPKAAEPKAATEVGEEVVEKEKTEELGEEEGGQ